MSRHRLLSHSVRGFPLRDEGAFTRVALELSCNPNDDLWRGVQDHLKARARGRSLDELQLLARHAWSAADGSLHTLSSMVAEWAAEMLSSQGASCVVHDVGQHAETVLAFRKASLYVPRALLLGAMRSHSGSSNLSLATPALRRTLSDHPWAELHVHAGASADFDSWWLERLVAHDARKARRERFLEASALDALRVAALLRVVVHECVVRRTSALELFSRLDRRVAVADRRAIQDCRTVLEAVCNGSVEQLSRGSFGVLAESMGYDGIGMRGAALTSVRAQGWREQGSPRPHEPTLEGARVAPSVREQETEIVRHYYAWRGKLGAADFDEVDRAFWQYQRLRCMFFAQLVEEPGVAGLSQFRLHYDRIDALGDHTKGALERAWTVEREGIALSALEVRPAMLKRRRPAAALRWARDALRIAQTTPPSQRPEVGVVLSFIKLNSANRPPSVSNRRVRFGDFWDSLAAQTEGLKGLFQLAPSLLVIVRGVDVASHELCVPTWVVAPWMRRVRQASMDASAELARTGLQVAPVRVTAHAGEDGQGAWEGLRRIDELLQSHTLQDGDRIGHGLALGIDVTRCAIAYHQPREERLFDLLWELDLVERRAISVDAARVRQTQGNIQRLVESLGVDGRFGGYEGIRTLWRDLLDERKIERSSNGPIAPEPRTWFEYYLTSDAMHSWGQIPIEVRMDQEDLNILEAVQTCLRREIARREIIVESNPTSNLLIADLEELTEHPMLRLSPVMKDASADSHIGVAICDDDPITFATSLADEVAYTYAALRERAGISTEHTLAWLERARQTGLRARFTVPESRDVALLAQLVASLQMDFPSR